MKRPATHRRDGGMGLIECLVAVALGATLAAMALALPASWTQRLQRAQARTALAQAAWWMEREAALSGLYPSQLPNGSWAVDGLNYHLNLEWASTRYVLRATPVGPQAADACGVLWLSQTGQRGAEGGLSACW